MSQLEFITQQLNNAEIEEMLLQEALDCSNEIEFEHCVIEIAIEHKAIEVEGLKITLQMLQYQNKVEK